MYVLEGRGSNASREGEHKIEKDGKRSSCEGINSSEQVVRWASEKHLSKKESVKCSGGDDMVFGGEQLDSGDFSMICILFLK